MGYVYGVFEFIIINLFEFGLYIGVFEGNYMVLENICNCLVAFYGECVKFIGYLEGGCYIIWFFYLYFFKVML